VRESCTTGEQTVHNRLTFKSQHSCYLFWTRRVHGREGTGGSKKTTCINQQAYRQVLTNKKGAEQVLASNKKLEVMFISELKAVVK
jgi:hypothetical protein